MSIWDNLKQETSNIWNTVKSDTSNIWSKLNPPVPQQMSFGVGQGMTPEQTATAQQVLTKQPTVQPLKQISDFLPNLERDTIVNDAKIAEKTKEYLDKGMPLAQAQSTATRNVKVPYMAGLALNVVPGGESKAVAGGAAKKLSSLVHLTSKENAAKILKEGFNLKGLGKGLGTTESELQGVYLHSSPKAAKDYLVANFSEPGDVIPEHLLGKIDVQHALENPFKITKNSDYVKLAKDSANAPGKTKGEQMTNYLKKKGYDGVDDSKGVLSYIQNGTDEPSTIIFDPEKLNTSLGIKNKGFELLDKIKKAGND